MSFNRDSKTSLCRSSEARKTAVGVGIKDAWEQLSFLSTYVPSHRKCALQSVLMFIVFQVILLDGSGIRQSMAPRRCY